MLCGVELCCVMLCHAAMCIVVSRFVLMWRTVLCHVVLHCAVRIWGELRDLCQTHGALTSSANRAMAERIFAKINDEPVNVQNTFWGHF